MPDDLIAALARQGTNTQNIVGIQAEYRMYDRRTGNFKAVGWICQVIRKDLGGPRITSEIAILDSEIRTGRQTTL